MEVNSIESTEPTEYKSEERVSSSYPMPHS